MGDEGKIRVVIEGDASSLQDAGQKGQAALDGVGAETKKLGGLVDDHNSKARAQFLLFSELNKILPGLGTALHAAFAGPLAPIIIAGLAIAEVTSKLKAYNAELDKQGEAAANPEFLDAINAQLEVFSNAAVAAQSYQDSLEQIATKQHTITTELENQLKVDQAIERAQAGLTSAQKALELARIQQAEAEHKITPEQAAEQRAALEKKYLEKAQADKEAAQNKERDSKINAFLQADSIQTDLEKKHQAAAAILEADESHRAAVKIDPAEQSKLIAEAAAKRQTAGDELRRLQEVRREANPQDTDALAALDKKIAAAQAEVDITQGKINLLNRQSAAFAATQTPAAAANLQKEKDAVADSAAAAKANFEAITKLSAEIDTLNQTLAKTTPIERATVTTAEKTIEATEKTRVVQQVDRDVGDIDRYAREKNPTPEAAARAKAAIDDLHAGVKMFGDTIATELGRLKTTLAQLDAKVKAAASHANPGFG